MAGGGGLAVRVWKEWGIQIMVVTSFLLQLVLLIFGGFRRRSPSAVLLAFLWLSYLMADNIAVYALGHMTLENRPRDDDGLVAFWATFFLLHLGGQDTITAFSMEDNQLWKRHLLTLMVQASGAGYAVYRYTIPGTWTLVSATIVMFIVGFLKYGERVWALQRGNNDTFDFNAGNDIDNTQSKNDILKSRAKMDREETILLDSHCMFNFCKGAFSNVSREVRFFIHFMFSEMSLPYKCNMDMFDLVEVELSLVYDLFYTKAQVINTWQGCLIRAISLLGTVSAFLLFRLEEDKGAYSRVDVSITYLLLVGAIILETTSVFRAVGSTWMCDYLHRHGWNRTNAMVMRLRRLFKAASQRRWLHSVGQHNVLDCCIGMQNSCTNRIVQASVPAKWREKLLSSNAKWRRKLFSSNAKITMEFKETVLEQILRIMTDYSNTWNILGAPAKSVLKEYGLLDDIGFSIEGRDFASCVLNWQIATNIYFSRCNDPQHEDDKPYVEAIKVISNYMEFLSVHHPSLLPGGFPDDLTVVRLEYSEHLQECSTSKQFAIMLFTSQDYIYTAFSCFLPLARELLQNKRGLPMLKVIFGVWVEFLCYAAQHSTDISHLRQLGRGGEFLTVIRLVLDHIELLQKHNERYGLS